MAYTSDMALKRVIVGLCLFVALTNLAFAQSAPQLVNYQGKLTDANGVPLETRDYVISVSIFGQSTSGIALWGPQVFDAQAGEGHGSKVSIVLGFFNVVLGPKDTAGRDIAMAFTTKDAYLEVTVEGGVPIAPRQQILATPYAIKSEKGNPPGTIGLFAGNVVPSGWLLCDGMPLSMDQYPRLWDAIDTTWGDGKTNPDGTPSTGTDFNLPNLQGRFLRGADNRTTGGDDPDAPRSVGTPQEDAFKSHNHPLDWSIIYAEAGCCQVTDNTDNPFGGSRALLDTGGVETRPKNVAVNYIIKY